MFLLAFVTGDNHPFNRLVLILLLVEGGKQVQVMHWLVLFGRFFRAKIDKHGLIGSDQFLKFLAIDQLIVGLCHIFNDIENVLSCFFDILAIHIDFKAPELSTANNDGYG